MPLHSLLTQLNLVLIFDSVFVPTFSLPPPTSFCYMKAFTSHLQKLRVLHVMCKVCQELLTSMGFLLCRRLTHVLSLVLILGVYIQIYPGQVAY